MFQLPLDIRLDDAARLDNFYIGDNSQLVKRLNDISTGVNEFYFIWGRQEAGKSHLAQAICRDIAEQRKAAIYIPLNNNRLKPEVLEGLEFAETVCLDSLESVIGDPEWEEKTFDLFNRLKLGEKNLVIFSRQPILSLNIMLDDLRSRLTSMEVYKLKSVTHEKQSAFIETLAQHRGLQISNEVASFLIARTERDVSKIIEMIELIDQQSLTHQRKITIPFVKQILSL